MERAIYPVVTIAEPINPKNPGTTGNHHPEKNAM
jgi:hypothetical protein